MDEDLGDREKIENMKFREKSWEDKKSTPKQTRPNVSAVSWTMSSMLRLYKCCQRVKDKGILTATQA